jgi:hypothetical protein
MIANELARRLRHTGFDAQSVHRDVKKTKPRRAKAVINKTRKAGKK